MIELKSCPKCHGDMYLDKDAYGSFRQCLQCGLMKDLVAPTEIVSQVLKVGGKAKQAEAKSGKKVAA